MIPQVISAQVFIQSAYCPTDANLKFLPVKVAGDSDLRGFHDEFTHFDGRAVR